MSHSASDTDLTNLTLITGGARSGKSTFAEALALSAERPVVYIATMEEVATDLEVKARIGKHRKHRPQNWTTIESAMGAHDAIESVPDGAVCIFDCLSLYISNVILDFEAISGASFGALMPSGLVSQLEFTAETAIDLLVRAIEIKSSTDFIVVTNEVGSGIVPENALGRAYRDLLGLANQSVARRASKVWLSCSGLQLQLKPQK